MSGKGPKLDASLKEMLDRGDPEQDVDLIVRSDGDIDPHLPRLQWLHFRVRRRFGLVPGAAVTGRAGNVRELAEEPWVVRIELDGVVKTQ